MISQLKEFEDEFKFFDTSLKRIHQTLDKNIVTAVKSAIKKYLDKLSKVQSLAEKELRAEAEY